MTTRHIPESVKFDVRMNTENMRCSNCNNLIKKANFDHWHVPYSVKPINESWNIRLICDLCNKKKGSKMSFAVINRSKAYDHQNNILDALEVYPFTKGNKRQGALAWSATSSGKTFIILMRAFLNAIRDQFTCILAPNIVTAERFQQDYKKAKDIELIIGKDLPEKLTIISGESNGIQYSQALAKEKIVIMTIPYALNRAKDIHKRRTKTNHFAKFDEVIIDEGHHLGAPQWKMVLDVAFTKARIIYASGTPVRTDKEPLPYVPYDIIDLDNGQTEYKLLDLADMTGMAGARFTLADARVNEKIKPIKAEYIDGRELKTTVNGETVKGEHLKEFKKKIEELEHRYNPFKDSATLADALKKCREIMDRKRADHPDLAKMLAIVKAYDANHAEKISQIANKVGWHAVPYYKTKKEQETIMEKRLNNFRDHNHPCDMIVQCQALTEGYNNEWIVMGIPLCYIDADIALHQFSGRGLRLIPDLEYNNQPEFTLVCFNLTEIERKVNRYINEANDNSFITYPTNEYQLPEDFDPKPVVTLEAGEFFIVGWENIRKKYDPMEVALREIAEKMNFNEDQLPLFKDLVSKGLVNLPTVDPSKELPEDAQGAKDQWQQKKKNMVRYCRQNCSELRTMDKQEANSRLWMAVNHIIGELYPSLDGGFRHNKNIDSEELASFLQHDLANISHQALKFLNDMITRDKKKKKSVV